MLVFSLLSGLMMGIVAGMEWRMILVWLIISSWIVVLYGNFGMVDYSILGGDLGGDLMSMSLGWLSLWVTVLMILASTELFSSGEKKFCLVVVGMVWLLMMVFLSLDLFVFYFAFESVLVPTLILIVGWGYQPERLQAGIYLIFYTVFASLPLLVVILWVSMKWGSMVNMSLLGVGNLVDSLSGLIYCGGVVAFMVKMPMFLLHLWLPKAHVEAPVSGSMVLAGILLKMGGYGLMRMGPLYFTWLKTFSWFWVGMSLMGGIYLSLVCLRQSDLKALIAYSSVVHMGLVIGGIMSLSLVGFVGSLVLMMGHGLCSSGLFCMANLYYSRVGSRSMLLNKGMMSVLPIGALMWFLLVSSNMAAPPSLNLLGEVNLLGSLLFWCDFSLVGLVLVGVLSASYSLYLFTSCQHGKVLDGSFGYSNFTVMEMLLLMLHWAPLNLIFLKSDLFFL